MNRALLTFGLSALGAAALVALFSEYSRRAKQEGWNLVDINSASARQLGRLRGMTPEIVDRLLENRPYLSKIDLLGRMIVPDVIYEDIKDRIITHNAAHAA
jgi:DNA uptake protein ComE-like DNA-binding protein